MICLSYLLPAQPLSFYLMFISYDKQVKIFSLVTAGFTKTIPSVYILLLNSTHVAEGFVFRKHTVLFRGLSEIGSISYLGTQG